MTVILCVGAVSMSIVYEFRVECDGETKEVLGATKGTTFKIVCAADLWCTVFSGNLTVGARLKKDRHGRLKTVKGEKRQPRAIKDP